MSESEALRGLTPAQYERASDLFLEALQMTGISRRPYLQRECRGDPQVLRAVEELLALTPTDNGATGGSLDRAIHAAVGGAVGSAIAEVGLESASAPSRRAPSLPPGLLLGERFLIERRLGAGGFGTTYLARDQHDFGEPCVVKVLTAGTSRDVKWAPRFEREAALLRSLDHAQIPKLLAFFENQDRLYLVQAYIAGEDLNTRVKRMGAQPEPFVRVLLEQVLDVLVYLHGLPTPVVHRDLKPSNLMLDANENVFVIDFGAFAEYALQTAGEPESAQTVIYSDGYAPASQVEGRIAPTHDLYALGITAVCLLTGRTPKTWSDRQGASALDANTTSPQLRAFVGRLLGEPPHGAFRTSAAALATLRGETGATGKVGTRAGRWVVTAASVVSLLAVGGLYAVLRGAGGDSSTAAASTAAGATGIPGAGGANGKNGGSGTTAEPPAASTEVPPHEVGPGEDAVPPLRGAVLRDSAEITRFLLGAATESNTLVLERDYWGRALEVTGAVNSVSYGDDGTTVYVVLAPQSPIIVKMTLPFIGPYDFQTDFHFGFRGRAPERLAELREGDTITVRGRFAQLYKREGEFVWRAVFEYSELP